MPTDDGPTSAFAVDLPQGAKDMLDKAKASPSSKPLELTVRSLLSHWGAKRRGYLIVAEISVSDHRSSRKMIIEVRD